MTSTSIRHADIYGEQQPVCSGPVMPNEVEIGDAEAGQIAEFFDGKGRYHTGVLTSKTKAQHQLWIPGFSVPVLSEFCGPGMRGRSRLRPAPASVNYLHVYRYKCTYLAFADRLEAETEQQDVETSVDLDGTVHMTIRQHVPQSDGYYMGKSRAIYRVLDGNAVIVRDKLGKLLEDAPIKSIPLSDGPFAPVVFASKTEVTDMFTFATSTAYAEMEPQSAPTQAVAA